MINIFSTSIGNGKGGISTALIGYITYFKEYDVKFNVINTHSDRNKMVVFFKAIKKSLRVKENDICWFHCGPWLSMLRKLFFIIICKYKKAKIVVHFHSPVVSKYVDNFFLKKIIHLFVYLSDDIIVVAPWWRQLLQSHFPNHIDKVIISFNPLDEQLISFSKENNINTPKDDRVNVLSLSRLVNGKGVDQTIRAFQFLPENYFLTISGDGPQEDYLKDLVQELGLKERINFTGWVSYNQKINLYRESHLFCLPSKLDSFGMVYLEAMAANLPIVALNYQAIPDVLPDFSVKLLDNPSNIDIANAIEELSKIKRNTNLSNYVLNKFSPSIVVSDFLENIYDKD